LRLESKVTPLFYALFVSIGVTAITVVAWVAAMDKNEPRRLAVIRARRGEPEMVQLPRVVARAAVTRKRPWSEWPR
jgi:hypothetical protein